MIVAGAMSWFIGRTKGGLNSKLHVLADAPGRSITFFLTTGPTSVYIGARLLLRFLPKGRGVNRH